MQQQWVWAGGELMEYEPHVLKVLITIISLTDLQSTFKDAEKYLFVCRIYLGKTPMMIYNLQTMFLFLKRADAFCFS